MLENYFKIAWRTLRRNKGFTFINIAGLAVGIASCLLLFIIVKYELGFDHSQKHFSRIYRVVTQDKNSDGFSYNSGVPRPLNLTIRNKWPNIKVGAMNNINGSQITIPSGANGSDNKLFIETKGMYFMEAELLEIFSFQMLSGNTSSFRDPGLVILTKSMAEKYFSNWQLALGKEIILDNAIPLKVVAILDDPTAHTDFPVGVIVSFETLKKNPALYNYNEDWGSTSSNFQVFALFPEKLYAASMNNQLAAFCKDQYKGGRKSARIHFFQPLSELHFDTRFGGGFGDHVTTKATIRTLEFIGMLILVMACINFINLATAQAVSRSKEVGVRKVLGGKRIQLFGQMMGETTLVVLIATLFAVLISKLALPYIKHIATVEESLTILSQGNIVFLVSITVIIILLSGSYPAMLLSGFRPPLALKNKISSASVGGLSLRRGLVVLQFSISQILVIGTIIAISQMDFVRHADLGFNKDALLLLNVNTDSVSLSKEKSFKQTLLNLPGVQSVTLNSDAPSSDNNWSSNFSLSDEKDQDFHMFLKFGDKEYLKTYGLELVAGRNYEASDTMREVLVNETLVRKLGISNPRDIIGKNIRLGRDAWKPIVGVLKDFKTNSLRETIKPTMISTNATVYGSIAVKLHGSNLEKSRSEIESSWHRFYPDFAFNASFLDENIRMFYQQEEQLSTLYKIFAGLAIFISCLGLYGLVSYMAVQKTKEVGIRKVLGASVSSIIYLFSKEFTLLIGIAFLIAVPVGYYLMSNWLSNFAYRITMRAWIFLLSIAISLLIAWFTVGYKAILAGLANPVSSLRSE